MQLTANSDSNSTFTFKAPAGHVYAYFALACAMTWILAIPTALAWMRRQPPPAYALACSGLSAFGPLFAVLAVAAAVALAGSPRRLDQLGQVFGRWRTNPAWVLLALLAPPAVHTIATALFVAIGGHAAQWFHPPNTPETVAALVVFPLGEEFGWRGFAHPRMVERFGLVRGSLILGLVWGVWHLVYSITPETAGFDAFGFGMVMVELPLYALLIAWVFERANRSMAVAIAFHAGAHLDHIERAPRTDLRLHVLHVVVLVVIAGAAAWSLSRRPARSTRAT